MTERNTIQLALMDRFCLLGLANVITSPALQPFETVVTKPLLAKLSEERHLNSRTTLAKRPDLFENKNVGSIF
jgi:hypothetical protein